MATKAIKQSRSSSKKKSRKSPKFSQQVKTSIEFLRSDRFRKISALFTILFGLFLFIAFISHFFTGNFDQSVVESGIWGNPEMETPSNWLGSFGAFFSYLFINVGFGITALILPIWMTLFGFAMLENSHYKFLWKLFKYILFVVLWGSAAITFTSFLFSGEAGDLGGGFGRYVNESLFNYIGKPGMGFLLLLFAGTFAVVNFNPNVNLTGWIGSKIGTKSKTGSEEEDAETPKHATEPDPVPPTDPEKPAGKDPGEDEQKKEEKDIVISVRKVAEDKPDIILPKEEPEGIPPTLDPNSLSLSIETPPVEQEVTSLSGDKELKLEIEEVKEDIIIPGSDEDNVIQKSGDTFEKYVPDEDKTSLDEEEDVGDWEQYDPTLELSGYQFPPLEILKAYDSQQSREVNMQELEANKNKIVKTLLHYKIEITHIKATIGPTVTLYEIVPAPGIRISKIRNLEDDIALSLSALGIRIIAPIPGKGTIGIEIPNSNPEIVSARSTLATEKFKDTKAALPIALGRTISNEVYIADLAKMPHMLIAGATGQGKSVGINGLISSLLYKKHPAHLKFVLIDPKKVELNLYQALENHFLAKLPGYDDAIITDTRQVVGVLNSLCLEMDNRYDLLKKAKVRNLKEYNEKFSNRKLNPRKGHRFLPYIVLIIDEFADLMMTAGKEIETPIARLAQLARAIGIHLVLATQRPSVNVITGIIKANFPARMSFRVTSKVDSRTILDTGGADQLIGRGDMLLSTGSDLIRIQNSFIDTPEVEQLVEFIGNQRGYPEPYYLPEVPLEGDEEPGEVDLSDRDAMFDDAARLVVQHQQGSTSLIQRRLKLGYNRAGRIIDQLEAAGIVGPFSGSKARDVLVQDEYALEQILRELD